MFSPVPWSPLSPRPQGLTAGQEGLQEAGGWEQAQYGKVPSCPGPYSCEPSTSSPPLGQGSAQSTPGRQPPGAGRHRFLAGRLAHVAQRQPDGSGHFLPGHQSHGAVFT